jgi:hypothetical protein
MVKPANDEVLVAVRRLPRVRVPVPVPVPSQIKLVHQFYYF